MFVSHKEICLLAAVLIVSPVGIMTPLAFATPIDTHKLENVALKGPIAAPAASTDQENETTSASSSETPTADAQSFDANGTINAVTYITKILKFNLQGVWSMQVRDGSVVKFDANMAAVPSSPSLGKSHTHQLLNYNASQIGLRDSNNNFFTNGTIDIGTNDKISWSAVPVVITIGKGETITIAIDDSQAGHHFAGQPIVGTVESITECSPVPGAAMSIESVCGPIENNETAQRAENGTETTSALENNETNSNATTAEGAAAVESSANQITVNIDSKTYGPNETPQISGKVKDPVASTVAQVDVSDSSGKLVYNTVAGVSADGSFFTSLKTFSPGQYTVVVTYHGNTGQTSFQVIETGG